MPLGRSLPRPKSAAVILPVVPSENLPFSLRFGNVYHQG